MNKNDIILTLNECFETEGNCAILYLSDGTSLVVQHKPEFFSNVLRIKLDFKYGEEIIHETVVLPYSNIMYITLTSIENMQKFSQGK